jgi:hypothetical protein
LERVPLQIGVQIGAKETPVGAVDTRVGYKVMPALLSQAAHPDFEKLRSLF